MNASPPLQRLSLLVAALATVAASVGLFSWWGDGQSTFTTLRGENADIYGRGIYEYDSVFIGAGNKGTDATVLFVVVPLLLITTWMAGRGSVRAALVRLGALVTILYVYASYSVGVAYNDLFLLYVASFSAAFWTVLLGLLTIDQAAIADRLSASVPRRLPGFFLVASGVVTFVVWMLPLVASIVAGDPPERLDAYTTSITDALDLALITPATLVAGILVLRREPVGYVAAVPLLIFAAMLAPLIGAQTVSQVIAGVDFEPAEIIGAIAGFVTLAVAAIWVVTAVLREIDDRPSDLGAN